MLTLSRPSLGLIGVLAIEVSTLPKKTGADWEESSRRRPQVSPGFPVPNSDPFRGVEPGDALNSD